MTAWEMIEDAPKGSLEPWGVGPRLLIADACDVYMARFCRFKCGVKGNWKDDSGRNVYPTHWSDLPAHPFASSEAQRKTEGVGR